MSQVAAHVLPEVGQLERRTCGVGQALPLLIAVPEQIEEQMPDRIGGALAVAQQVIVGGVATDLLVHTVGLYELQERLLWNLEAVDRFTQRNRNGMCRRR